MRSAAIRQGSPDDLWAQWLWRLPVLRKALTDPDIALRLKRAGLAGADRKRSFVLSCIATAFLAVAAGLVPVAIDQGEHLTPPMTLTLLSGLGLIGLFLPSLTLFHLIRQRQEAFRHAWPDALDLLLLSVEAGLGLEAAMAEVAKRMERHAPDLAAELQQTLAELAYLPDRRQAFANLSARVDLPVVNIVTGALIQAERYGTPIAEVLRAMAQDTRAARMAEAERRAGALPPRLTVPMIIFFLPVLFAVIFTPGIILYLTDI
jgi:tight adherence protein C